MQDTGQQGKRRRRYSNTEMVAAKMRDGDRRDGGQQILRFLDDHDVVDVLWKGLHR